MLDESSDFYLKRNLTVCGPMTRLIRSTPGKRRIIAAKRYRWRSKGWRGLGQRAHQARAGADRAYAVLRYVAADCQAVGGWGRFCHTQGSVPEQLQN